MAIRRGVRRRWLTIVVIALVAGCAIPVVPSDGPAPPPSEGEARAFLAGIVGLAMRGDFEGLCAVGSGTCQDQLRDSGRDAVPPLPPRIVGTRVVQPQRLGDAWSTGGFVLQVCGIDGRGEPYFDEVLVLRDGSRLISIGTVYWSRTRIAEGQTAGGPQPTPPPECPT
jgi:hypothetical protein